MKILLGLVSIVFGWVIFGPAEGWAADPAIRLGLIDQARSLTIRATDPFILKLPSKKTFTISGSVTVTRKRNTLLLNNRVEVQSPLWIEDNGQAFTIWANPGKTPTTSGAKKREWVVQGPLDIQTGLSGLALINWIELETYVAGVVSGEVSPKWPPEALKAQAVAARTYVLYKKAQNAQQPMDVVASVQDQVYHGHAKRAQSVLQAIAATKGEVLTYENRPIYAAYSSTAAGPTENALYVWALDLPYLKGVDCPFDERAPRYNWEASFSLGYLEQQLRKEGYQVGKIATLTPYTFTASGRVDRVRLLHSQGEIILRGQDLRRVVGYSKLLSTQFSIESFGTEVVVVGHGAGHAVGMCQWGMREMANLGYDYQSILQHYYPGTTLLPLEQVNLTATAHP